MKWNDKVDIQNMEWCVCTQKVSLLINQNLFFRRYDRATFCYLNLPTWRQKHPNDKNHSLTILNLYFSCIYSITSFNSIEGVSHEYLE